MRLFKKMLMFKSSDSHLRSPAFPAHLLANVLFLPIAAPLALIAAACWLVYFLVLLVGVIWVASLACGCVLGPLSFVALAVWEQLQK